MLKSIDNKMKLNQSSFPLIQYHQYSSAGGEKSFGGNPVLGSVPIALLKSKI